MNIIVRRWVTGNTGSDVFVKSKDLTPFFQLLGENMMVSLNPFGEPKGKKELAEVVEPNVFVRCAGKYFRQDCFFHYCFASPRLPTTSI